MGFWWAQHLYAPTRCNQCRILVLPQDHLLAYSFRVELGWQIFYCGKNKFRKWDVAQALAFPINPQIPVKFLTRKTRKKSSKWCLFILGIARSTRAFSVIVFNYKPNPHPSHWVCPWVELWDKIHTYFHNQMNAKAVQLSNKLRNTEVRNRSIQQFLLKVKVIMDSLFATGDPMSSQEQLNEILQGLPPESDVLVTFISRKFELLNRIPSCTRIMNREPEAEHGNWNAISEYYTEIRLRSQQ